MAVFSIFDVFLILTLTAMGSIAQLFLKKGAQHANGRVVQGIFNVWTISGGALIVVDTIGMVFMLRFLSLTYVLPLTALHYVFVPLGAVIVFGEKVSRIFWLGAGLIVCSVTVIILSGL